MSLIELLVVMALLITLVGITIPAFTSISRASNLTRGAQVVLEHLSLARQMATTRNIPIEFRLYKFSRSGGASFYQAIQLFGSEDDGRLKAVTPAKLLPDGVAVSENKDVTSFVGGDLPVRSPQPADPEIAGAGRNYTFIAFRFRPDGTSDLTQFKSSATNGLWFLTLTYGQNSSLAAPLGSNYATVQLEPLNGNVRLYRP